MASVVIPYFFHPITLSTKVEIDGNSVSDIIFNIIKMYPPLKNYLLTEDNHISPFINFYINDKDIRFLAQENTPVNSKDVLRIVPAIAGG